MSLGKLYLIPVPLASDVTDASYTLDTLRLINGISEYIVENEKTARRFLKEAGLQIPQKELRIHDYGKHAREHFDIHKAFFSLMNGKDIGLMSEAGCPGVADPGSEIVAYAHEIGVQVIPLVGPSSILLSLMASGFNGQSFSFVGYLPIDRVERIKKIKFLENKVYKEDQTQIFIETPFRNNQLLDDLLKNCKQETKICIASNLTSKEEVIITKKVNGWKKSKPDLHKKASIFLIYK